MPNDNGGAAASTPAAATPPAGGVTPDTAATPAAPTMGDTAAASANAASASAATPMAGTKETPAAPDWRQGLGDLDGNPDLKSIKDVRHLAEQFIERGKHVGQKEFGIPGEDATPEQKQKFWQELGVPEKAEDYGLTERPDNIPEDKWNPEHAKAWQDKLHEFGVPKDMATKIVTAFREEQIEALGQAEQQPAMNQEQFMSALNDKYGDQTDAVIDRASDLLAQHADMDTLSEINSWPTDQRMALLNVLNSVHQNHIGEDRPNTTDPVNNHASPQKLREDARALMATDEYRDAMNPNHEATRKRVQSMYQEADRLSQSAK